VSAVKHYPIGTLAGLGAAIDEARACGTLEPFPDAQCKMAGAEVFISGDRKIRLIRQYDIQTDTYVWRVSALSSGVGPDAPLGTSDAPLGDGAMGGTTPDPLTRIVNS
jgi:hypothetical protein